MSKKNGREEDAGSLGKLRIPLNPEVKKALTSPYAAADTRRLFLLF